MPHTEGGDKVQGSVDPRFAEGLRFLVPEIQEFRAFRDSGKIVPTFSRNFPASFPRNPRRDPPSPKQAQPLRVNSETQRQRDDTLKKICVFQRGGHRGEGNCLKKLFFVGNATTIKFWKCNFFPGERGTRALVIVLSSRQVLRLWNAFKKSVFEASKLLSTKTLYWSTITAVKVIVEKFCCHCAGS